MKIFDSHAHYNDDRFEKEYPGGAEAAIRDSFEAGVAGFINVGTNVKNSLEAIQIAKRYANVYAAVGLHPEDAAELKEHEINSTLADIEKLLYDEKVVALGEIGLDYHWDTNRARQHEVFYAQLEIAEKTKKPVIIHDRDAHGDTFDMLAKYPHVTGVMHSYSGSAEMVRQYSENGWYISFGGPVTYKTAHNVRKACSAVPLDRLLIETDCPYLPPHPHRGKINYSGYLPYTINVIADTRGITQEEVADITLKNAERLFNIKIM